MKASSVRAGKGPRVAVTAVIGLSALAVLGGCGFETRQQAAAIVNGQVITEAEVAEAAKQLNDAKVQVDDRNVLAGLIAAPLMRAAVEKTGTFKQNATYAAVLNAVPNASEATKTFASALDLIQPGSMTDQQVADYFAEVKAAKVTLNPRYGTLTPSEQDAPVYFRIGSADVNWIAPPQGTGGAAGAPDGQSEGEQDEHHEGDGHGH